MFSLILFNLVGHCMRYMRHNVVKYRNKPACDIHLQLVFTNFTCITRIVL
jgi:hypothetical protein